MYGMPKDIYKVPPSGTGDLPVASTSRHPANVDDSINPARLFACPCRPLTPIFSRILNQSLRLPTCLHAHGQ